MIYCFSLYKINESKTLKFNNIRVNKREFHKSKQPIDLNVKKCRTNSCI